MPTVGVGHGLHLSMGTGALLYQQLIPLADQDIQQEGNGPNVYFVRTRPGVSGVRTPPARSTTWPTGSQQRPDNRRASCSRECSIRPRSSTTGRWDRHRPYWPEPSPSGRCLPSDSRSALRSAGDDGSGPVEDPRIHPSTAGVGSGLAGFDSSGHRYGDRCPLGHRSRAHAMGAVRRRALRCSPADGVRPVDRHRGCRLPWCWPIWWPLSPGGGPPARPPLSSFEPNDTASEAQPTSSPSRVRSSATETVRVQLAKDNAPRDRVLRRRWPTGTLSNRGQRPALGVRPRSPRRLVHRVGYPIGNGPRDANPRPSRWTGDAVAVGRPIPTSEVGDLLGPFLDHVEVVGPGSGGEVLPPAVGETTTRWTRYRWPRPS